MDRLLQIVQGCHKYDRRSQRLLYERYYGYALRISFRYMDSYEETRQLTNDMFLTVFQNFSGFKHDDKKNVDCAVREWIKSKMIEAVMHDFKASADLCKPAHVPATLTFFRKERLPLFPETPALYGALITSIRELPPVLRFVFNLYAIDRYPQIGIAKMVGIRVETAETYIRVARQICLKPYLAQNTTAGENPPVDRNLR
jgi:DNA-directed RNA polymerase specialized sigma24 family protein